MKSLTVTGVCAATAHQQFHKAASIVQDPSQQQELYQAARDAAEKGIAVRRACMGYGMHNEMQHATCDNRPCLIAKRQWKRDCSGACARSRIARMETTRHGWYVWRSRHLETFLKRAGISAEVTELMIVNGSYGTYDSLQRCVERPSHK